MSLLRIPLSYASADAEAGTVEIWYAVVGDGTERLSQMSQAPRRTFGSWRQRLDDSRAAAAPARGGRYRRAAGALPGTRARRSGHSLHREHRCGLEGCLVGEDEFEAAGAPVISVATDDGSYGYHGFCTAAAEQVLELEGGEFDYVAACGPEPMMAKVAAAAAKAGVPCEVSLERMMSCASVPAAPARSRRRAV